MGKPQSIRDIIVKAIARDLRGYFPSLRIEGHPATIVKKLKHMPSFVPSVLLEYSVPLLIIVKGPDAISIRFVAGRPKRHQFADTTDAILLTTAKITTKGDRQSVRDAKLFDLVDPNSIPQLEKWILKLIKTHLNMEKAPAE